MNPLSTLFDLFRKKPITSGKKQNERWLQGYSAFEAGKKHSSEQRPQEALDCFDMAVECGVEDATLFSSRVSCLQALQWDLEAIDDFTKAILSEPQDCNHYFQRAMSKDSTGDQQGFLADIQEAIRLSKVDNALTRKYHLWAKDTGQPSVTAIYERQLLLSADTPDFVREKYIERTKLRGRRKDKLR